MNTESPTASPRSRGRAVAYALTTGLVALAMLAGGASDLLQVDAVRESMAHLGYPDYFALVLGGWKVLGAVALLAPGFPRLKEWAYAGIAFDLSGAVVSHLAVGDGIGQVVAPVILLLLLAASHQLRPASRRL